MNDYERIRRIIRHLDEHYREQPTLAELAEVTGLSAAHFHRMFVKWVGITPKSFVQCLTLEHARRVLRDRPVLDAALDAGLSGPGRLHDLCVTLEAATPGEIRRGGRGLEIVYGIAPSPFGDCLLASSERGVCHLSFVDESGADIAALIAAWPEAIHRESPESAGQMAAAIFGRAAGEAGYRAFVRGSPFQLRVWRALLGIPRGALSTYKRLAAAVGHPSAARAVGTAVGSNPLAYLIPCHRVIRETGALGGYRWNLGRKRALIAWETSPPDS